MTAGGSHLADIAAINLLAKMLEGLSASLQTLDQS
jgi:hypothetical protein